MQKNSVFLISGTESSRRESIMGVWSQVTVQFSLWGTSTVGATAHILLFGITTVVPTVVSMIFLDSTVGRDPGRQLISCFLGLRLSRQHKMTVHKPTLAFHTVISKDDFSKLTV